MTGLSDGALGRRMERLERGRAALLEQVAPMSPDQLTTRPAAGGWHVLDVVQHVIIVEELVLRALATRPGPLPLADRLRSGLRLTALRIYLRAGGRLRTPTPAILPQGSVPLDELRARWERVRAGYASALAAFGPADLARPMMKHPIVGKLTPKQTLTFLDTHLAHHGRQIERIRRAVAQ
ncbi:MAG: DinB family protein [Gemmatimonadales bacterium]